MGILDTGHKSFHVNRLCGSYRLVSLEVQLGRAFRFSLGPHSATTQSPDRVAGRRRTFDHSLRASAATIRSQAVPHAWQHYADLLT